MEWIDNIIAEILNALKAFGMWILDLLVGFGQVVIEAIIGLLPTDANGQVTAGWAVIETSLIVANAWVPLDFAISLVAIYIVFIFSFLCTKIIIKLIP